MPELYSFRSPNTITKFDDAGNPVASYATTPHTCDCPAGQRPTCRHRQMLAQLEPIRDTHWFLQWDREVRVGLIVDINGTPKRLVDRMTLIEDRPNPLLRLNEPAILGTSDCSPSPKPATFGDLAEQDTEPAIPPLPKGVQMFTLDDPGVVHSAIARAVGEPALAPPQPFRRRI